MGKKLFILFISLAALVFLAWFALTKVNINPFHSVGEPLDSLDGVVVYYNGGVGNVTERNETADGYNIGLKYQCVEFVKRYYLLHFNHRMPDSYGHAKDFFDPAVKDGNINPARGLVQYCNGGKNQPKKGDLLVLGPSLFNPYGHVAIVVAASDDLVEVIQQNPGAFGDTRESFGLAKSGEGWEIQNRRVLGWLRMNG